MSESFLSHISIASNVPASSPYMYDLHLRTLSSNEPHPNAPTSILQSFRNGDGFDGTESAVRIQVSGDVIGFLIKETSRSMRGYFEGVPQPKLSFIISYHNLVFKWRTPSPNSVRAPTRPCLIILTFLQCALSCFSGIDDFTFLSKEHFLLVRPNGLLEVYSFSGSISDPMNPAICARYALPILSDAYTFWYLSLSSNPSPGYFPGLSGEKKTYYSSPEDRLIACSIYVFQSAFTDRDTVYPFVFFVHPKTFLCPPPEWQDGNVDVSIPFPFSGSAIRAAATPSPPNSSSSDRSTPSFSSPPASDSESEASSSSSVLSSASSVSLGGPSHVLNFPAPQATYAGPSSMLLNASPPPSGRLTPPRSSRTHSPIFPIPWEVWGPQSTRWFREGLSKDWQHSVYGLRTADCVLDRAALVSLISRDTNANAGEEPAVRDDESVNEDLDDDDDDEENFIFINDVAIHMGRVGPLPKFLRVRDFNPYSVSKAMEELAMDGGLIDSSSHLCDGREVSPQDILQDRGGYQRVVTGPSKINVRGVFRNNIVSCLPYVEVISEDTFNVNEVMIDDCRLLLVKVRTILLECY